MVSEGKDIASKVREDQRTSTASIAVDTNPSRSRGSRARVALVAWHGESAGDGSDARADNNSTSPVGRVLGVSGIGLNLDDVGQILSVRSNGSVVSDTSCSPGQPCRSTVGVGWSCDGRTHKGQETDGLDEFHVV